VKSARALKEAPSNRIQGRIVEAAITCIERDGLQGVTIRSIAREAGVNSAAISYYFRSKDVLMNEALAMTLENAFGDWEVLLREKSGNLHARIRAILVEIFEGSLRFPGIVRAHLYDTFVNGTGNTAFIKRFTKFLSSLTQEMSVLFPDGSVGEIGAQIIQMVSAVLLPGILPQLYRRASGMDFSRTEGRTAYVDSLLEHYFPIAARGRTV